MKSLKKLEKVNLFIKLEELLLLYMNSGQSILFLTSLQLPSPKCEANFNDEICKP